MDKLTPFPRGMAFLAQGKTRALNRNVKAPNGVLLKEDEGEKHEWVLTPDGPAKIWGFFSDGRVGLVLRSDILGKADGERPVRFCQGSQVWPWTEGDLIFCEPPKDQDGRWRSWMSPGNLKR